MEEVVHSSWSLEGTQRALVEDLVSHDLFNSKGRGRCSLSVSRKKGRDLSRQLVE